MDFLLLITIHVYENSSDFCLESFKADVLTINVNYIVDFQKNTMGYSQYDKILDNMQSK